MIKFLSLGFMFLFVLFLSGCDLIPAETIEKATEELCREDPTNALCEIDNIEDLEDQVIIDLFNNVLTDLKVDDSETFCEDYFSVTNIDLLDKCTEERLALFPSGIEMLTTISASSDGDFYVVLVENLETYQEYEFRVQTERGSIGIMVSNWGYTDVTREIEGAPEGLIEAKLFDFISDLENPDMSDAEVCATWYDNKDNDCDGIVSDASRKFKAGADLSKKVNILDDDDDGDSILEASVSFEHNGHVTVLKISIDINNTGEEFKLMILESEIEFTAREDVADELKNLISDLQNPDLPSEDVCLMWITGDVSDDECKQTLKLPRPKIKIVFVLKTIAPPQNDDVGTPVFEAIYEADYNGHVTVLKISYVEDDSSGELKLKINDVMIELPLDLYLDGKETLDEFQLFISDYLNPDITFEALSLEYFDGELNPNLRIGRDADIKDGATISLMSEGDPLPGMDLFYKIDLEINRKGDTEMISMSLRFIRKEVQDAKNKMQIGFDETLSETEAEEILVEYLDNYSDSTVSISDLNALYFEGTFDTYFALIRNNNITRGTEFEVTSVMRTSFWPDSFFDVEFEVNTDGAIERPKAKIKIKRIDMATPLLFGDFFDVFEYYEVKVQLGNLVGMINDGTINADVVCPLYFGSNGGGDCNDLLAFIAEGEYVVSIGEVMMDKDMMMIDFIFENAVGEVVVRSYSVSGNTPVYILVETFDK